MQLFSLLTPDASSLQGKMGCYCGLATKGNKLRWAIAGVLTAIGIGLLIGYMVESAKCKFCSGSGQNRVCRDAGDSNISDDAGMLIHLGMYGQMKQCPCAVIRELP
jgi:hypothetical protein